MTKTIDINEKIFHFGLDHLEIYGTFKDEEQKEVFSKLDFDNSNYGELEDYVFTKNEVRKYEYKIIFTKNDYSLFAYYKGLSKSEKQPIGTRDYIVIYSTAFQLLTYQEIQDFLERHLELRHMRRFDICMDVREHIDTVITCFNELKTGREYRVGGELETRYIGEVRNARNKRQLIRIYNKQKDILAKKKLQLYEGYLLQDAITRIELEVRSELAKNIGYKEVFNPSTLQAIFKNYLRKHTDIFDGIPVEKMTLYKVQQKVLPEVFEGLYYRTQRKKIFIGHARTIYEMGFCPVCVLIGEGYFQESTGNILGVQVMEKIRGRQVMLKNWAIQNPYIESNHTKNDW